MTSLTLDEYKTYLKTDRNFWGINWDDTSSSWPYFTHPQAKCAAVPFPNKAGEFAHIAVNLPMLTEMDRVEWGGGTHDLHRLGYLVAASQPSWLPDG
jgi:hypothetical protein